MQQVETVELDSEKYALVPLHKVHIDSNPGKPLMNLAFLCLIGYVGIKAIAGLTGATLLLMMGFLVFLSFSILLDLFNSFKLKNKDK